MSTAKFESIVNKFTDAMIKTAQNNQTQSYTSEATVTRVEGDTVWVHIPGGVDETPVDKTISCRAGDVVRVGVASGRAWLQGNATAPPTDDRTANIATQKASTAQATADNALTTATSAEDEARRAKTAADAASGEAIRAKEEADKASDAAEAADKSAKTANAAANNALAGLSTVEDVVNTVTWIATHGVYSLTTDKTVQDGKTYYKLTATEAGKPTVEEINTYYERKEKQDTSVTEDVAIIEYYEKTKDYEIDSTKTYYTVTGTPVSEPSAGWLDTYYELDVSDAVSNYINTHLALTDEGLYVLSDKNGWKVLVKNDGVYIVDPLYNVVSKYSQNTVIGREDDQRVKIDNSKVDFITPSDKTVMTIDSDYYEKITEDLPEFSGKGTTIPTTPQGSFSCLLLLDDYDIARGEIELKFLVRDKKQGIFFDSEYVFNVDYNNFPSNGELILENGDLRLRLSDFGIPLVFIELYKEYERDAVKIVDEMNTELHYDDPFIYEIPTEAVLSSVFFIGVIDPELMRLPFRIHYPYSFKQSTSDPSKKVFDDGFVLGWYYNTEPRKIYLSDQSGLDSVVLQEIIYEFVPPILKTATFSYKKVKENQTPFIRIGEEDKENIIIDSKGMSFNKSDLEMGRVGYGTVDYEKYWDSGETEKTLGQYTSFGQRGNGNIGEYSFTNGTSNVAPKPYSSAFGINTRAADYGQFVIGRNNIERTDRSFIIGNGYYDGVARLEFRCNAATKEVQLNYKYIPNILLGASIYLEFWLNGQSESDTHDTLRITLDTERPTGDDQYKTIYTWMNGDDYAFKLYGIVDVFREETEPQSVKLLNDFWMIFPSGSNVITDAWEVEIKGAKESNVFEVGWNGRTWLYNTEPNSTNDTFYVAKRLDTDLQVSMGIGSGGENHGVYSHGLHNWLIWGCREDASAYGHPFARTYRTPTINAASKIITANSTNATITGANYTERAGIAQLYLVWTNKKAITVPANGNITNVQVGRLFAGKRPAIITAAHSAGDGDGGACWYTIGTDGNINLGACEGTGASRTIAASKSFYLFATYIVA